MTPKYDRIPEIALDWHRRGKGAALATVIETWGSAPRPVGSQLVVSGEGEMEGSVSGGCVEGAVVIESIDCLEGGTATVLEFGVADEQAFAVGLACGGRIRVLVEPVGRVIPVEMLEALVDARAAREQVAYVVNPDSGARRLVTGGGDALEAEINERFRKDKSGFEGDWFIGIHNPPLRMAIVGAVHIAQALVPMARLAGYDPVVIDPRPAFGAEARFPGETLIEDWPDEALAGYGLDPRTAVVTLTHDPKLDDPAIKAALGSDCFYLGCLGSTRTHAKRIERLKDAGFSDAQITRIHGPVGLDIGAQGPAEIAISIMAEITTRLRKE
ncbi:XdhC family protein [Nioella aestuarii]|uniref:XdhC family protein n=1 Tax=Nioella aestuarii TaxID=1662864 RepID=UPI003D7FFF7E